MLGVPSYFSLGFLRPGPDVSFGSSPRAFGAPGAGGSFAFADPDARLGYAYVMNKMDFYLIDEPTREGAARRGVPRDESGSAREAGRDALVRYLLHQIGHANLCHEARLRFAVAERRLRVRRQSAR